MVSTWSLLIFFSPTSSTTRAVLLTRACSAVSRISIVLSAQSMSPMYLGSVIARRRTSACSSVQGYIRRDLLFRYEPAHPRHAGLDHALADLQLLFGKPQHLIVRLGQFGRHRNFLHGGNRCRSDRRSGGFDLGDRSKARGNCAVFHVDRPVDVQNASRVGDLSVGHPDRYDHTAAFKRLVVHIGFVLS